MSAWENSASALWQRSRLKILWQDPYWDPINYRENIKQSESKTQPFYQGQKRAQEDTKAIIKKDENVYYSGQCMSSTHSTQDCDEMNYLWLEPSG